jgi:hypothetical protein
MEAFFEKISSYNIINYILPGSVFMIFSKIVLGYEVINENILLDIFILYFTGLVISRIGSLLVEPLLKKLKFIKFAPYNEYVIQEKKDQKIKILNEHNNMFRTLCTTMFLLLVLKLYMYIAEKFCFSRHNIIILIVCLFVLFLLAYRKQSNYIIKRVEANAQGDKS